MKKISLSIATAAVVAMTAVTGTVAAELPTYEKAGLPVSAVQLQVLGAENVQEATPVATSITPVQLSVSRRDTRSPPHKAAPKPSVTPFAESHARQLRRLARIFHPAESPRYCCGLVAKSGLCTFAHTS